MGPRWIGDNDPSSGGASRRFTRVGDQFLPSPRCCSRLSWGMERISGFGLTIGLVWGLCGTFFPGSTVSPPLQRPRCSRRGATRGAHLSLMLCWNRGSRTYSGCRRHWLTCGLPRRGGMLGNGGAPDSQSERLIDRS